MGLNASKAERVKTLNAALAGTLVQDAINLVAGYDLCSGELAFSLALRGLNGASRVPTTIAVDGKCVHVVGASGANEAELQTLDSLNGHTVNTIELDRSVNSKLATHKGMRFVLDEFDGTLSTYEVDGKMMQRQCLYDAGALSTGPSHIATDEKFIYISQRHGPLLIHGHDGTFVRNIPIHESLHQWPARSAMRGITPTQRRSMGIAVRGNNLFMVTHQHSRIHVSTIDGSFIVEWPIEANVGGPFYGEIAVDDSYVYVTCAGDCVRVFDHKGNFIRDFGKKGELGNDKYYKFNGIAVDDDFVYMADGWNQCIQVFQK